MSLPFQSRPEFTVVVDFAVKNDPDSPILVGHRLMAAPDIDNRQPTMAEPYLRICERPRVIGPPMGKGVAHPS
jgi:hypothetical protein